jgi:hypothetical protein
MCNTCKPKSNTTGYKGVSFHKRAKKYHAQIRTDGKLKHLGLFKTAEKASKVYEAKAKEIHGQFYYKNK